MLVQNFYMTALCGDVRFRAQEPECEINDAEEKRGFVSQVNQDFEEESVEQRPSVGQPDLLPFECLVMSRCLPKCYWPNLLNSSLIFLFCPRWQTFHPLISRYCHTIVTCV